MAEEEYRFQDLVHKYLSKEISDQELDELKFYLKSNSSFRQYFDRENEIWQITEQTHDISHAIDKGWNLMEEKLNINNKNNPVIIISRRKIVSILSAASVMLVAGISFLLYMLTNGGVSEEKAEKAVSSIEIRTEEGEKASLLLPDSTLILLNSGTIFSYDDNYNENNRVVRLRGEAYFDVKTNPEKPFIVQLDSIFVTATGTQFNIYSYKNDDRIEATLIEGHISVTSNSENKSYEIFPGQQAVYFCNSNTTQIRDVTTETYTSWKENKLRLIDTPIEEALRKIARRYNVVFEIQGLNLLELKYTATFIDESIEDVMQMLETVTPISYRIYNRTSVNDKLYLKPKIVIWPRKGN